MIMKKATLVLFVAVLFLICEILLVKTWGGNIRWWINLTGNIFLSLSILLAFVTISGFVVSIFNEKKVTK